MMFTSGTQALQGRTVDHDPEPWWYAHNGQRATGVESAALDARNGYDPTKMPQYDPRPEFAVLDNPILVKYRQSDERTQWHMRQGSWISWPAPPWPDGAPEHAHRVLARLAQWKEN